MAGPSTQAPPPPPPPTTTTPPPLPPPHLFDILPPLHELLARIDHTSHTQSLTPDSPTSSPTNIPSLGARYTDLTPLDPKDLATETLALKAKIRRALRELEKLPDMQRSVAEQREEISRLEERIGRQREMVRRMGSVAGEAMGRLGR